MPARLTKQEFNAAISLVKTMEKKPLENSVALEILRLIKGVTKNVKKYQEYCEKFDG